MFTQLRVRNFKAWKGEHEVELAPLSLFLGGAAAPIAPPLAAHPAWISGIFVVATCPDPDKGLAPSRISRFFAKRPST